MAARRDKLLPGLNEGIADIAVGNLTVTESNVRAGAKPMDQLMKQSLGDAKFDEQERTLLAFASYNAGRGNVAKMRRETEKRGLDSDKWFSHVEPIMAEKIRMEPATCVRNVFKYYVSYQLAEEAPATAAALKRQVAPAGK